MVIGIREDEVEEQEVVAAEEDVVVILMNCGREEKLKPPT